MLKKEDYFISSSPNGHVLLKPANKMRQKDTHLGAVSRSFKVKVLLVLQSII